MDLKAHDYGAALLAALWLIIRIVERLLGKDGNSQDNNEQVWNDNLPDRVQQLERRCDDTETYIDKLRGNGNPKYDVTRRIERAETWLRRIDSDEDH